MATHPCPGLQDAPSPALHDLCLLNHLLPVAGCGWTPVQAVWVFTTSLPLLLLNTASTGGPRQIIWSDIVGVGLWVTGFLMESVADWQKWRFKEDPTNRGRFIDSGLWTYARYPNYCGEMLVW